MTDDVITLDVTSKNILWQMLSCGLTFSTYKIVKVIKLLKKVASNDSGIIFMMIVIYFYNYYYQKDPPHKAEIFAKLIMGRQINSILRYVTDDACV